jgi:hypothetical protein
MSHCSRQQQSAFAVRFIHANTHQSDLPTILAFTPQQIPPGLRHVIQGVCRKLGTPGEDAPPDHPPHLEPKLMKVWSYNSTSPLVLHGLL